MNPRPRKACSRSRRCFLPISSHSSYHLQLCSAPFLAFRSYSPVAPMPSLRSGLTLVAVTKAGFRR